MNQKNIKNDKISLRRAQLIKAAYKVLSKKGYHEFTIRDIAKEADLSTGLVHYYFKDKQDLLVSVLKDINENLRNFLNKSFENVDSPVEKLKIFMKHAFDLAKDEAYFSVIFDFWTLSNNNDRMHNANMKLLKSYRIECSKIIEEGIAKGVFKITDVEYVTAVIISVIQGMIIQFVIDRKAFNYDLYADKVSDQIFKILNI